MYNILQQVTREVQLVREIVDSHHKHKVGFNIEEIGCLAVDIGGYLTVSVLMGILFINIFGPVV